MILLVTALAGETASPITVPIVITFQVIRKPKTDCFSGSGWWIVEAATNGSIWSNVVVKQLSYNLIFSSLALAAQTMKALAVDLEHVGQLSVGSTHVFLSLFLDFISILFTNTCLFLRLLIFIFPIKITWARWPWLNWGILQQLVSSFFLPICRCILFQILYRQQFYFQLGATLIPRGPILTSLGLFCSPSFLASSPLINRSNPLRPRWHPELLRFFAAQGGGTARRGTRDARHVIVLALQSHGGSPRQRFLRSWVACTHRWQRWLLFRILYTARWFLQKVHPTRLVLNRSEGPGVPLARSHRAQRRRHHLVLTGVALDWHGGGVAGTQNGAGPPYLLLYFFH